MIPEHLLPVDTASSYVIKLGKSWEPLGTSDIWFHVVPQMMIGITCNNYSNIVMISKDYCGSTWLISQQKLGHITMESMAQAA